MFGSTMLDTMIGMIFVFLAVSLAVTAANELFASLLRWRAKDLEQGIKRLLQSEAEGKAGAADKLPKLFPRFKNHALIQGLFQKSDRFPSYISSQTFAMVLLDLARVQQEAPVTAAEMRAAVEENAELPPQVKKVLLVLLREVENDVRQDLTDFAKLQEGVERWFDGAMDRVGGWYKSRAHFVSFALAAFIAGLMNVDCIEIVQTLSRDATLRQSIAAQAAQIAQKPLPPAPAPSGDAATDTAASYQALAGAVAKIEGIGLPLGWPREFDTIDKLPRDKVTWWWITKCFGLLLTALAASLGAPFWFDLLNRFVSIRGVGKPPSAPEPHG